jgi:hypothetical protein
MSGDYINLLHSFLSKAVKEGKLTLENGYDEQRMTQVTDKLISHSRTSFYKSCILTGSFDYLYLNNTLLSPGYKVCIVIASPFLLTGFLAYKEIRDYEYQKNIVMKKYERQLIELYPELERSRALYPELSPVVSLEGSIGNEDYYSYLVTAPELVKERFREDDMKMDRSLRNFMKGEDRDKDGIERDSGLNWDPYGMIDQSKIYRTS